MIYFYIFKKFFCLFKIKLFLNSLDEWFIWGLYSLWCKMWTENWKLSKYLVQSYTEMFTFIYNILCKSENIQAT